MVRQRGEQFTPKELEFQAIRPKDPDGVEIVVRPEDPFAGLTKLMMALESINGKSALDRKGERKTQFYLNLHRKPGERPAEFPFFDGREGLNLPSGELGWFPREKLGLDPLRKQLLETALWARKDTRKLKQRPSGFSRTSL